MNSEIVVIGHIAGLSRLYEGLLQAAEIWISDELYPYHSGPAEDLVKEWLLDVNRVIEPVYADIDDPIRMTMEVFWKKPHTEELFYLLVDDNREAVDIGVDERDRFYLTLLERSGVNESFIDRFEFRQSASF